MADLNRVRQAVYNDNDSELHDLLEKQWSLGYLYGLVAGCALTAIVMTVVYL